MQPIDLLERRVIVPPVPVEPPVAPVNEVLYTVCLSFCLKQVLWAWVHSCHSIISCTKRTTETC